jgi:hypothetical protein
MHPLVSGLIVADLIGSRNASHYAGWFFGANLVRGVDTTIAEIDNYRFSRHLERFRRRKTA